MPHDIRLAGPWDYRTDLNEQWQRCTLPFDGSVLTDGEEKCELRRKFHRPSGLDSDSRLFIVVQLDGQLGNVRLNGETFSVEQCMTTEQGLMIPLPPDLKEFNELLLGLASTESSNVQAAFLRIVETNSQA